MNDIIVKKPNEIIESPPDAGATILYNKMLLQGLSELIDLSNTVESSYKKRIVEIMGKQWSDDIVAVIDVSKFRKDAGYMAAGSFYKEIEKLGQITQTMKRQSQTFFIDREAGLYISVDLIHACIYNAKEGKFYIHFESGPAARERLIDLKRNYTLLSKKQMMRFRNVYSWRIFEILFSRMKKAGHDDYYSCYMDYSEFRIRMGLVYINNDAKVIEQLYAKNPNYQEIYKSAKHKRSFADNSGLVRNLVLEVAKREIYEYTDYEFDYRYLRGPHNKITDIVLTLKRRIIEVHEEAEKDILEEIMNLFDESFSAEDKKAVISAADGDKEKVEKALALLKKQKSVKNPTGWLISCIRNDFKSSKSIANDAATVKTNKETMSDQGKKKKKNSFHNFHEREYTPEEMEQIEQMLLNAGFLEN